MKSTCLLGTAFSCLWLGTFSLKGAVVDFDFGWEFALKDMARMEFGKVGMTSPQNNANDNGVPRVATDTKGWKAVTLPHDWALELPYAERDTRNGYKAIGAGHPANSVGLYRKWFAVPADCADKRLFLRFDGVYRDAQFWMNGVYLGRNESGYIGRVFEVTDFLRYGATNNFVNVRVDASKDEGWWYDGAGICRHVTLEIKERDGLRPDTAFIRLKEMKGADAVMAVDYETLETGTHHEEFTVPNARLWSTEDPYLHTYEIRGEKIRYGIRTVVFDPERGLLLNGRRVEVRGVCCHQDHAGVGVALPDAIVDYRIRRLKSYGVNAYRTSHNPPSTVLLDACDRHGILVLDETRLFASSDEGLSQFERLIRRDRNHPSVVAYSVGNEEHNVQGTDTGRRMAETMKRVQRRLDPTRVISYGGNNGGQHQGVNEVTDVRGVNYIRLVGVDNGAFDKYHADHPSTPVWGSEEASSKATRGQAFCYGNHTQLMADIDPVVKDLSSWAYGAAEWTTRAAKRPWFAGAFVWTGFDYRGECYWPAVICNFGVLDLCGFDKNLTWYYRARWTDQDVLQVYPHANAPTTNFWVNTNCDKVELFVNGRSVGVKARPDGDYSVSFPVDFTSGTVEARGVRNGRDVRFAMKTSGRATQVAAAADRTALAADGKDATVVNFQALDAEGNEVFDSCARVYLRAEGAGRILGVGNGNPLDIEEDVCTKGVWTRRLFHGKCQAVVQSAFEPGELVLSYRTDSSPWRKLVVRTGEAQSAN